MTKLPDCISFPPKAKTVIYLAPAKKLNSSDLRPVSSLTAVYPYLSPKANNVSCPASNIKGPNRKNVISKLSESEEDTMEHASKNVVNDMSKPAIVNNTKLPIETNIKETDCKRISDFCTFPNVENKEYVLGNIIKPKIIKLSVKTEKKMNNDSADSQTPVMDQIQFSFNLANLDIKDTLNNSLPQKENILREAIPKYSMRAIIPLTFA